MRLEYSKLLFFYSLYFIINMYNENPIFVIKNYRHDENDDLKCQNF